jgi:hypothetical protein
MKIIITSDDKKVVYGEFTVLRPLRENERARIEFEHPIAENFSYIAMPKKKN